MSGIKKQSWKVIGSLAMLLAAHSVAESAELELRQLNWLGTPDGDIMASRIFEAELSFNEGDPNDLQLLQQEGGGYVNIAVQAGDMFAEWAVRNVYLAYPDVERLFGSSPSFQFGLPIENGTPIGEAFVIASITPQVLEEPFPQIEGQVMVTPDDYMTGGRVGGGTYLSDIPFTLGPLIGSSFDSIPVDWAWVGISVDDIAEVDENIDGCAPGSCARSISYLGDLHDLDTEDPQDIFADLKEMMNTNRPGGTSDPDMLAGKDEYTSENGLPIESHLTYGDDSLQEALDAVADGCDVEILISWSGGGGHAAMVTSVTRHSDGSYTITYVDDPTQNNGEAENEEHTIKVEPDGDFAGGHVDGFLIECIGVEGDVNGDLEVNVDDLLQLLGDWGACDSDDCPADFDDSGDVGVSDLLTLLANWG